MTETASPKHDLKCSLWDQLAVGCLVIGVVLYVFSNLKRPLWIDEYFTLHVAYEGLSNLVSNLRVDAHPPLYFSLASILVRLFGYSEIYIRCLSIVFFLISVAYLFFLAASLFNRRTALFSVMFFMLIQPVVWYAPQARHYSMLILMVNSSTFYLCRILGKENTNRSDLIGYTVAVILGVFTHLLFFPILAVHGLYVLCFKRTKFLNPYAVLVMPAALLFSVFWLDKLVDQVGNNPLSYLVGYSPWSLLSKATVKGGAVHLIIVLILTAIATVICPRCLQTGSIKQKVKENKDGLIFCLMFIVCCFIIPALISIVHPLLNERYTVVTAPFFAILAGFTVANSWRPMLAQLLAVFSLMGLLAYRVAAEPFLFRDYEVTKYIVEHSRPNDIIVYGGLSYAPIKHYLRVMNRDKGFEEITFPREVKIHPGHINYERYKLQPELLSSDIVALSGMVKRQAADSQIWFVFGKYKVLNTKMTEFIQQNLTEAKDIGLAGSENETIVVAK